MEEQQLVIHLQFGRSCQYVILKVKVISLRADLFYMLLLSSVDLFLNFIFQTILSETL